MAKNSFFHFLPSTAEILSFFSRDHNEKTLRASSEGICQKDFTRSWNFNSSVNTIFFGKLNTKVDTNCSVVICSE